jgi:hypothetical protein
VTLSEKKSNWYEKTEYRITGCLISQENDPTPIPIKIRYSSDVTARTTHKANLNFKREYYRCDEEEPK